MNTPTPGLAHRGAGSLLASSPGWLLAAALVLGGLALRYVQFNLNRVFWLDEAWLAVALEQFELLAPARALAEHQAAPLGFLVLTKLGVAALGDHEWVHRLLPFVCGCLLLLIWYPMFRPVLGTRITLLSLALVALSAPLVHYAAEFKPYGVDAFVSAVMTGLLLRHVSTGSRTHRSALAVGVVGVLALLLSFTATFVLAAGGLALLYVDGRRQHASTLLLAGVWALCFVLYYVSYVVPVTHDVYLEQYWSGSYAPWDFWRREAWNWYGNTMFAVFSYSFGELSSGVACAASAIGFLVLASRHRPACVVIAGAVAVTLVASLAGSYPLRDRLVVFLLPLICIAIAAGLDRLLEPTAGSLRAVGVVLAVMLFVPALYGAATFSQFPLPRHNPLPLLEILARDAGDGDTLYVEWPLVPVIRYYAPRYGLSRLDLRFGENRPQFHLGAMATERWPVYERELLELRGRPRVWIILDRFIGESKQDEAYFIGALSRLGSLRFRQEANHCVLYLYDLVTPMSE